MRLREFAPSPERDDNDDVPDQLVVLANRWWNATDRQPQIEHVLNSLGWSIHQVESEDDAVQLQHRDGTTHFISADDFDPDLFEAIETVRAHRGGLDLEARSDEKGISIYAHDAGGRQIAFAHFDRTGQNITGFDTSVRPEARGQGIAAVMYDWAKELGHRVVRSKDLTDAGRYFWQKNRGQKRVWEDRVNEIQSHEFEPGASQKAIDLYNLFISELANTSNHRPDMDRAKQIMKELIQLGYTIEPRTNRLKSINSTIKNRINEISDELRRGYLDRAGRQVDRRMDHMARVRDRLNKGYEIYHADRPAGSAQIVDRFEADTPALAQQYYERFIHNYESDVDFDLRLRRATGIMEIARIPQGDFGDADTLAAPKYDVEKKELPGGAGFTYAVGKPNAEDLEIMIFDGDTLAAELDLFYTQDVTKAWRVNTVAVNPAYRNRGLGKALYGIALSILQLTIEAGDTQTRHGQRMWLMLNSIPGVEVLGYNMERTKKYKPGPNDKIIKQDDNWTRYTFPVKSGVKSMRSGRRGTGMYTSQASMIARWIGQ
jgi:GNAT superfamily N-acetyltransferase